MQKDVQMSESFIVSSALALAGGFQDAYTYLIRGRVFANAQTGNIVLLGANFIEGKWRQGFSYLFPVSAFIAGVFVAEFLQSKLKYAKRFHWRQTVILLEIAIMLTATFIPHSLSTAANVIISLSCAMQVQTFRKVNGHPYASTMCIGNLRSGSEALFSFAVKKNKNGLAKAKNYFGVILVFFIGASLGSFFSNIFREKAIILSCVFLLAAFFLMHKSETTHEKNANA